jgi:hypothetical protein
LKEILLKSSDLMIEQFDAELKDTTIERLAKVWICWIILWRISGEFRSVHRVAQPPLLRVRGFV